MNGIACRFEIVLILSTTRNISPGPKLPPGQPKPESLLMLNPELGGTVRD